MELLNCTNLEKHFTFKTNVLHAVDGISLHVNANESIAIMGPSGCGKTTLLNMLGGLLKPTAGSVVVNGLDMNSLNETKKAKLRNEFFGFVLQQFGLIQKYTVLKNCEIPLKYHSKKISRSERIKKIITTLSQFNVDVFLKQKVKHLSGGERQRVAISRAIINDPQIILADEPTGSLDQENSQLIMSHLLSLVNDHRSLIVVTHDINVAQRCDTIINMRDGKFENIT